MDLVKLEVGFFRNLAVHNKTVERGKERTSEKTRGKRGGNTSRFERFLSL